MKTPLDVIETRLQAFIEGINLFPWVDPQESLARKLTTAMRDSMVTDSDGIPSAPASFTIFLHPDTLASWQVHQDQLDALAQMLQETAQDAGLQFLTSPTIHLAADDTLPQDGLRISATSEDIFPGQTDIIETGHASEEKDPSRSYPLNAFLIVEGANIFPLDRMVVNIGRRAENHLVLEDPRVSRNHAQLRAVRGKYVLFDLNSSGGTFINGHRIHQQHLKPGDVISLAGVSLIYGEDNPENSDDTGKLSFQTAPDDESPKENNP